MKKDSTPSGSMGIWLVFLWIACAISPSAALAHSFAPTVVTLSEETDGTFWVLYQAPANGESMTPSFPLHCSLLSRDGTAIPEESELSGRILSCGAMGLRGHPIVMKGSDLGETLLTIHFRNREVHSALLHREPHLIPPLHTTNTPTLALTLRRFFGLGVHHILSGIDHLLLLLGLLLLVPSGSALLLTVTAFTVGHSATLALAALGVVTPPPALVEALIALSVAFVAKELVCVNRSQPTLRPLLLAVLFGLLHGLGFASALRETELPSGQLLLSLLSFNCGVEAGQLVFVLALWLPARFLQRQQRLPWVGYVMGPLAMAWTIERSLILFGKGLPS